MLLDSEIGATNVIGMNTMTPHPAALSLTSFSLLLSHMLSGSCENLQCLQLCYKTVQDPHPRGDSGI